MTKKRATAAAARTSPPPRSRTRRAPRAAAAVVAGPSEGVVEALEAGEVLVRADAERWRCAVLRTHAGPPLVLALGEVVLFTPLGPGRGCVLGRVEPYDPTAPAELHLRATESMTLTCGESSVELSAHGKVAVRGVDVVTTAKRKNRIKGGSVDIN